MGYTFGSVVGINTQHSIYNQATGQFSFGTNTLYAGSTVAINGVLSMQDPALSTAYISINSGQAAATMGEAVGGGSYRWLIGRSALAANVSGMCFGDGSYSPSADGSAVGMVSGSSRTLGLYTGNGTSPTLRTTIDGTGNLVHGTAALATTATDGFIYLPTCAGTPTGAPTAKTGRSAFIYDTTANKWWVYNGSWRGVVVS